VKQDIDAALRSWEYKPGSIQARLVEGSDGRQVIQMRVDLGILQLERLGRPDGTRPHGYSTYFDYLQHRARVLERNERTFAMSEKHCEEADREFVQFYHRRICWLALQNYAGAMADADHTLAFMDFVKTYVEDEEYVQSHEQYRGFVLFQRTQAAAAMQLEQDNPASAIDEIHAGLDRMREFFHYFEADEQMEENPMIQHLRKMETSIREQHKIGETLQEQLARAIANEEYEKAARLRDALRRRREKA
jgi:hypothetical protein